MLENKSNDPALSIYMKKNNALIWLFYVLMIWVKS